MLPDTRMAYIRWRISKMSISGGILLESFVTIGIMVIIIIILVKNLNEPINFANRVSEFRGMIIDGKYFRHYECKECRNRVNIMKDTVCKQCGAELFEKR